MMQLRFPLGSNLSCKHMHNSPSSNQDVVFFCVNNLRETGKRFGVERVGEVGREGKGEEGV